MFWSDQHWFDLPPWLLEDCSRSSSCSTLSSLLAKFLAAANTFLGRSHPPPKMPWPSFGCGRDRNSSIGSSWLSTQWMQFTGQDSTASCPYTQNLIDQLISKSTTWYLCWVGKQNQTTWICCCRSPNWISTCALPRTSSMANVLEAWCTHSLHPFCDAPELVVIRNHVLRTEMLMVVHTYALVLIYKETLASHRPIPGAISIPSVTTSKAGPTLAISVPGKVPHQYLVCLVQQQCVVMTLNIKIPDF